MIDMLAGVGLPPPDEFIQLRDRLGELQTAVADGNRMQARLTDAVLGDGGDIPGLYAAALAEASGTNAAPDVLEPLHGAVLAALQTIYAPHAKAHYRVLRDRFNAIAKAFVRCAGSVDPGRGAADAIIGNPDALQSWRSSLLHADELDALVEPVVACAELVRGPSEPSGLGVSRVPLELPLFVDLDGIHKRRAWEAWTDQPEQHVGPLTTPALQSPAKPEPTRGGRWTRLHRIGAPIRAIDNPEDIDMYGPPQPIGVKQVTQPAGPADNPRRPEWQRFDPCDDEIQQPKGPMARLAAFRKRHQIPDEVNLLSTVADADDTDQEDQK
jgi:hypothetical protein